METVVGESGVCSFSENWRRHGTHVKQLKAYMSKLCRAVCHVVIEVVVTKLDNQPKLFLEKAILYANNKS